MVAVAFKGREGSKVVVSGSMEVAAALTIAGDNVADKLASMEVRHSADIDAANDKIVGAFVVLLASLKTHNLDCTQLFPS